MAVQKSRKTRSKRGMRRSHDALQSQTASSNERGLLHRRHHMAADGTYRGKQIIDVNKNKEAESSED